MVSAFFIDRTYPQAFGEGSSFAGTLRGQRGETGGDKPAGAKLLSWLVVFPKVGFV